jgi:hypothetical protein
MESTAQQIPDSLMNGNLIHDNAILHLHQAGLMEQVAEIVKAKGLEVVHESDYYVCKGHAKLMAAKVAKDAADKAAAVAKEAAGKAAAAKAVSDQAAKDAAAAASAAKVPVDPAKAKADADAKAAADVGKAPNAMP